MKISWKWLLGLSLLLLGIWYFALKEEHYRITFISDRPPGVIYSHILDWDSYGSNDFDSIHLNSKLPYSEILQEVYTNDSIFSYRWALKKHSEEETKVTAYIKDVRNGFKQKLQVPFGNNSFIKKNTKSVKNLLEVLQMDDERYRVHSFSDTVVAGGYCVYLPIESTVEAKAKNMLINIATIMEYINKNEIELQGDPFLEVTKWDKERERISFNFCFPIEQSDSIPTNQQLKFKTVQPFRALKVDFNGNYRISNKAWYYLLDHAKNKKLEVVELPFEVYLDDPHVGGNPLNWKAHILLPYKEN